MIHLDAYQWWLIGRYGAAVVFAGVAWLSRQSWLPHRHDGYVAASGYVHTCSRCSALPAIDDPVTCPRCGDVRSRPAAWAVTGYETDHCAACYLAVIGNADEETEWVTCPRCGREDVAAHTMAGGQCARCNLIDREDALTPEAQAEARYGVLLSKAFAAGYNLPRNDRK
jgi:DNA-directed RNA polymerase subunit RPC12/RpoP